MSAPGRAAGGQALRVYLVTDTVLCGQRGVVPTIRAAVAGGVTAVQVRDPSASGRALLELTEAVIAAVDGTGVPVIVNDRLDVALAAGAAGVHLGQTDLPPAAARALAGPGFLIGWSVPELAQLSDQPVDYLGVGPVYVTATKADAGPAIGVEGLAAVCAGTSLPVVGIGGIDETNAAAVIDAGAVGVAVVSAICASADPAAAARRLADATSRPA